MNSDQGINPVAPSSERLTLTPEDMELIERLVDDELNESERTRLLERLERVPEGWRACALSFLENQTFASALRGLNFVESADRETSDSAIMANAESGRDNRNKKRFLAQYAVAAAALIACTAFLFKADWGKNAPVDIPNVGGTSKIVSNENSPVPQAASGTVRFDGVPLGANSEELAKKSQPFLAMGAGIPSPDEPLAMNSTNSASRAMTQDQLNAVPKDQIRTVKLNYPQYGLNNVSASCVESDHYDPELLRNAAEAPSEILEQLREEGGRVNARREEYRFSLGDGRVLILPVDSYDVRHDQQYVW